MSRAGKADLRRKVREHLRALEAGKKAYKRAEELLDEIVAEARIAGVIRLGPKRHVVIRDLYAEKNRVYRAHGITRFELQVVEED